MTDVPNRTGFWRVCYIEYDKCSRKEKREEEQFEVYELEPCGNKLCFWGQDLGIVIDATDFWNTDEWLGHIPVEFLPFQNAKYEFLTHDE